MSKKNVINRALGKPAEADVPAQDVLDLLGLVQENPPSLDTIAAWTQEDRVAVAAWAGREHLCASDNDDLLRLPRPSVLDPVKTASVTESATAEADALTVTPSEAEALGVEVIDITPREEQWDITVDGDPMAWYAFCDRYDVHPLYIEDTELNRRLVCLCNFDPAVAPSESIHGVEYGGLPFLQVIADNGFTVTAVRHHVSRVEAGETPAYYEAVVSLDGPIRVDRTGSTRNLYTRERWYRTKRSEGPFNADAWLELATSTSKPSKAVRVTYSAVLA